MSFDCTIEKHRLAVITVSGRITGAELVDEIEHLVTQPEWEPGMDALWDMRNVTEMTVSRDDLERYQATITRMRDQLGNGRVAVVAQRHLVKQMSLVFAHVSPIPERKIKVNQSIPEALEWLGVDGSTVPVLHSRL